jgi:hypothetical protein
LLAAEFFEGLPADDELWIKHNAKQSNSGPGRWRIRRRSLWLPEILWSLLILGLPLIISVWQDVRTSHRGDLIMERWHSSSFKSFNARWRCPVVDCRWVPIPDSEKHKVPILQKMQSRFRSWVVARGTRGMQ